MNQGSEVHLNQGDSEVNEGEGLSLLDLAVPLARNWRLLAVGPLLVGLFALGASYLIAPTFTSRTVFLPPQVQQSTAASALASLGALSGLAGAAVGIKSPVDQYAALLQSTTVADRLIDEFKLQSVYGKEYRSDARNVLAKNVRIGVGKKDGLLTVEVDDVDPSRAAAIANRYVDELRRLTSVLALSEAQQRRQFFEGQLTTTRDKLTQAQIELQASGFNPGALKAEPRAAAENYAKMRAEVTAAEVRLRTLRQRLADPTPEIQQQQTLVFALRAELEKLEANTDGTNAPGYIGKYREFKYQETLFDLFSRQFELARLDESREGALIQVVDAAVPAERKSRPKRAVLAVGFTLAAFALLAVYLMWREWWRKATQRPLLAQKLARLRLALGESGRSS